MEAQKRKNKEQGIILIEAIIAIGVLATMFVAALSLHLSSVTGMRMTNDQLMAMYLAQDGIEQVIAKRQYNYDNDLDWLDGMNCPSTNPCAVDYYNSTLESNMTNCGGNCELYIDSNGIYSHNNTGTTLSYFSRAVEIDEINAGVEARVTVRVNWMDGGDTPMSMPLTYNIFNNPNDSLSVGP